MITKKRAHKKGTCPLCKVPYTRGTSVYYDKRKAEPDRYVHSWCWEKLLWERTKDSDPAPF